MARSSNSIRFGLNPRGLPYDRIVAVAQAAEAAGFQNISFSDRPPENNLEGWTLATAVARCPLICETPTIRGRPV